MHGLADAFYCYAMTKSETNERKKILKTALTNIEKALKINEKLKILLGISSNNYHRGYILSDLAKLEPKKVKKIQLLTEAISSMETCIQTLLTGIKHIRRWSGRFYYRYGRILDQLYTLTEDISLIQKSIEIYHGAIKIFQEYNMDIAQQLYSHSHANFLLTFLFYLK